MTNMPTSLSNGRYQLGKLLGRGGMAEVRVALDTRLGRTVAVKIMRSDFANDEIFLSRFRREAHAVAQMNNPNIVNIHDSGEETVVDEHGHVERVPYIVMEYVEGQTLRNILKATGALSQQDAEQVIIGVLNALDYSHRRGIVHRDIKPGNIMISDQGVVKVMDFGIARALDDSAATMTQAQGVVGTAQYLSPEQARGENVDLRSDIYSAGCVLYEMLTGKPPFTGDSAVAIAYQHVSEVATPPSIAVPGLPKMWDQICAKAMAKDRQNRYATAAEFRGDIYTFINGGIPKASDFNMLSDLANQKARNTIQQDVNLATAAMPVAQPTVATVQQGQLPQSAQPQSQVVNAQMQQPTQQYANAGGMQNAPQFAPPSSQTGQFSPFDDDPERKSRVAMRAEENSQRKRKTMIISSIVAALVVIVLVVASWWFIQERNAHPKLVAVPTLSSTVTRDGAEEKLAAVGLRVEFRNDSTSDQQEGTFTKQKPSGGTQVEPNSVVIVWFSTGPQSIKIPDVKGATQDAARDALTSAGFKVAASTQTEDSADVEKDHVTRTDPASGSEADRGSTVLLYVSSGRITVPDKLIGHPKDEVLKILHDQQFNTNEVEEESDSVPAGSVTKTDPAAGTSVNQRSMVTVYVSKGKPKVDVSADIVFGQTQLGEAVQLLTRQGFVVKTVNPNASNADIIIDMNPKPGTSATKGSTVTITTKSQENSNTNSDSPDTSEGDSTTEH